MDIGKVPGNTNTEYQKFNNDEINTAKNNKIPAGNLSKTETTIDSVSGIKYHIQQGLDLTPEIIKPEVKLSTNAFKKSEKDIANTIHKLDLLIIEKSISNLYSNQNIDAETKKKLTTINKEISSPIFIEKSSMVKIKSELEKIHTLLEKENVSKKEINRSLNIISKEISSCQKSGKNGEKISLDEINKSIKDKITIIKSINDSPAIQVIKGAKNKLETDFKNGLIASEKIELFLDDYKNSIFGHNADYDAKEKLVTIPSDNGVIKYSMDNGVFLDDTPIASDPHETKILTDFFQLMAVFHELSTEMRRMHREGRNVAQESIVEKIELQAEKKLDAAFNNMVAGMISGSMKVASGGINLIGGAMAAKADAQAAAQGRTDGMAGRIISMRAEGISSVIQGVGEMGSSQFRYMAGIDEAMETRIRADEERARFVKQHEQDQMDINRDLTAKARESFQQVFNAWMQGLQKITGNI